MELITKPQFILKKELFLKKIRKGAVFIYPTDTIYGIGCNALNSSSVKRIRKIKKRPIALFSVAVPSKDWILRNCIVDSRKDLAKLPGKYTLILPLKNKKAVSREVNMGASSVGIRIPKSWFSGIIAELGIPVVSTSANIQGKPPMSSLENLDGSIAKAVDFIVYDGPKAGKPSVIIDVSSGKRKIIKR